MFYVVPDNWRAFDVFSQLSTQWRHGFSGATGLDYSVISDVLRINQIPETDWRELFDCIQVMEREALSVMHRKE